MKQLNEFLKGSLLNVSDRVYRGNGPIKPGMFFKIKLVTHATYIIFGECKKLEDKLKCSWVNMSPVNTENFLDYNDEIILIYGGDIEKEKIVDLKNISDEEYCLMELISEYVKMHKNDHYTYCGNIKNKKFIPKKYETHI